MPLKDVKLNSTRERKDTKFEASDNDGTNSKRSVGKNFNSINKKYVYLSKTPFETYTINMVGKCGKKCPRFLHQFVIINKQCWHCRAIIIKQPMKQPIMKH